MSLPDAKSAVELVKKTQAILQIETYDYQKSGPIAAKFLQVFLNYQMIYLLLT